jgi:hypothetical protein
MINFIILDVVPVVASNDDPRLMNTLNLRSDELFVAPSPDSIPAPSTDKLYRASGKLPSTIEPERPTVRWPRVKPVPKPVQQPTKLANPANPDFPSMI